MVIRIHRPLLLSLLSVMAGVSCDSGERRAREQVSQAKDDFLSRYDPERKAIRNQLAAEIANCDRSIAQLNDLERGFQDQSAKIYVNAEKEKWLRRRELLLREFTRIDAEAEKGVALETLNAIGVSGQVEKDIAGLVDKAQATVAEAKKMNAELATAFGQRKFPDHAGETPFPRPDPEMTADSRLRFLPPEALQRPVVPNQESGQGFTAAGALSADSTDPAAGGTVPPQAPPAESAASDLQPFTIPAHTYHVGGTADGFLNLRSGPGSNYQALARIPEPQTGIIQTGRIIWNLSDKAYWMPVRCYGMDGYVSAGYLHPD